MFDLVENTQRKQPYSYQSCHEKRHRDVYEWVGFLARHCPLGSLTFFEIPNKSFLFYALSVKTDINKIEIKFFFFVFYFSLVSQCCSYVFVFNISSFSIAQRLENICIQRTLPLVKSSDTIAKTHMNKPSELE